jgi:hypothetical protein
MLALLVQQVNTVVLVVCNQNMSVSITRQTTRFSNIYVIFYQKRTVSKIHFPLPLMAMDSYG